MQPNHQTITFRRRELKGSRLRCLIYTAGSSAQAANRLTRLIAVNGVSVAAQDFVMPRGFLHPEEAMIGRTSGFLEVGQRNQVIQWWLKVPQGARIPTWDIAANATIEGRPGLVLVEAKAHVAELKPNDAAAAGNIHNFQQIVAAINSVNVGLPGLNLSHTSHYQLANRFAWSWKIASLGVPVVLVYLGFLNAEEWSDPFTTARAWVDCVLQYSQGRVPVEAWGRRMMVEGTPFIPLIRAAELRFEPHMP